MSTMPERRYPIVRGFEIQDKIGEGGFSTVFRAVDLSIPMMAACKVVTLTRATSQSQQKELHKEIRVHSQLSHKNVLNFLGSMVVEDDGTTEYVPAVYILLELAGGGDLFDKIVPDSGVDEELAHVYFNQLISALKYIHGIGICHRDLKPENLLLDSSGRLKLSDFGLCSVYKHKGKERTLSDRCGSLPYVAPEINNTHSAYKGEPIDVWGAGVILFTLLVGNTPWDEPGPRSPEYAAFLTGEIWGVAPWDRIRDEAQLLLLSMLNVHPSERTTIREIASHPWVIRSSNLGNQFALASRLAKNLSVNGDMDVAEPNFIAMSGRLDQDEVMMTATNATQFTKTLQLFSQTQRGERYDPHLTRFYAATAQQQLAEAIFVVLQRMSAQLTHLPGEHIMILVNTTDKRNTTLCGVIQIEHFAWQSGEGSRCVMMRRTGNPMEWRRLWKHIIVAPEVEPFVLRRQSS